MRLRSLAGSRRFVYDTALAIQKENHEAGNKFVGYVAMVKHLPALWSRIKRQSANTSKILMRRLRLRKITPMSWARSMC